MTTQANLEKTIPTNDRSHVHASDTHKRPVWHYCKYILVNISPLLLSQYIAVSIAIQCIATDYMNTKGFDAPCAQSAIGYALVSIIALVWHFIQQRFNPTPNLNDMEAAPETQLYQNGIIRKQLSTTTESTQAESTGEAHVHRDMRKLPKITVWKITLRVFVLALIDVQANYITNTAYGFTNRFSASLIGGNDRKFCSRSRKSC